MRGSRQSLVPGLLDALAHDRGAASRHLEVELTLKSASNFYSDLDPGRAPRGLFVARHEPAAICAPVSIHLRLPGDVHCYLLGIVYWTQRPSLRDPRCVRGVGIELVEPQPEDLERIEAFVAARPPMLRPA
jgi:hypothetical protein